MQPDNELYLKQAKQTGGEQGDKAKGFGRGSVESSPTKQDFFDGYSLEHYYGPSRKLTHTILLCTSLHHSGPTVIHTWEKTNFDHIDDIIEVVKIIGDHNGMY